MRDPLGIARKLIADQFPAWSHLPVRPVASTGTDNYLFRLGDDMVVRMPAVEAATRHAEREARWLPWFADRLRGRSALKLPTPIAVGKPDSTFPWPFAICQWLEGDDARTEPPVDMVDTAGRLAEFVSALRALPTDNAPRPGQANVGRGCDLVLRDEAVRYSISKLTELELMEPTPVVDAWQDALNADTWTQAPEWHHGDLHSGNLLTREGQLSAVIDWGLMAAGDPAVDLLPAWYVFDETGRDTYRRILKTDDASWRRGRGWALSMAVVAWPYYLEHNPTVAEESSRVVGILLASNEQS